MAERYAEGGIGTGERIMGTGLRGTIAAVLLIAGVALVGSDAGAGRASTAAPVQLRVGYFPNITHAQAVLGFGTGVFQRALSGVTVEGRIFNAGPDEMNAIFAGAIDLGYIGPGPAINGYVKSHGAVYVIAGAATAGMLLVARSGSGITSVKDLAGKTVAIPQLGNTQDIVLRALLKDNGLAPSESGGSVHVIAVQNPDTLALFEKGDLDAALVPEPWGSRLIKQTGAHVVLDANQIYGGAIPATVIIVAAPFLKAHPDVVVRFLRVHAQLTRQLQETRLQQYTGGVEADLNAQIKTLTGKKLPVSVLTTSLHRTAFTTAIDVGQLKRFAGFSIAAGYLSKGADTAGLVDNWPLAHLDDKSIK